MLLILCLAALAYGMPLEEPIEYGIDEDLFINSSYIVAGQKANNCEFPSIVSLQIQKNGKTFLCGGSIMDANHVITAAHCVASGVTRIIVFYGATSARQAKFTYATKINAHPGFYTTSRALHNDVAILKLGKPILMSTCVKAIPLASTHTDFAGKTCITAGWGKTSWTSQPTTYLRKVSLPIMSYKECHAQWNYIGHEHICAGDWIPGGASPCQGDSGGPLYCMSNGHYVLAGLVSFGLKCEYGPAMYTSVSYFRTWINANTV
ncbi:chymotrypsin B-like [Octopus sinensis]|uniref:Chymotrypsin B-like n=1 Tax=Octopus sinensis TaxID=2607531 RepID=A0A6P7TG88_9MOLL|nr:chymotrypsin B-like [Octopus sinensis]